MSAANPAGYSEPETRSIDYAFIAMDLNERAKAKGLDGLSDESLDEMAWQLAEGHGPDILDDYEARLGVDVSWARERLEALYAEGSPNIGPQS